MRARIFFAVLLASYSAFATQVGLVERQLTIEALSDSSARNYTIARMEMSGDGQFVAIAARQTTADSRGCTPLDLRLIDIEMGTDTEVVPGRSWNTGVGNNCADTLTTNFHLDHDGSELIFESFEITGDPDNPTQEGTRIERYRRTDMSRTTLVRTVPHTTFSNPGTRRIQFLSAARVTTSGDGSQVFWFNSFGPEGAGQPVPSGFTFYRLDTTTMTPSPIITEVELQQIPGLTATSPKFCCLSQTPRPIHSNFEGSKIVFNIAEDLFIDKFRDMVSMDPGAGAASGEVIFSIGEDLSVFGPSLDLSASRAAFSRAGSMDPMDDGLYIVDVAPGAPPSQIRGDRRFDDVVFPRLSADGSTIAYSLDQNFFAARSDGFDFFNVSEPMTYPTNSLLGLDISEDGQRIAFIATYRTDGQLGGHPGTGEVMLLRQNVPAGFPTLDGVVGDPSILMSRDPTFTPPVTHTFFLSVSGTTENLLTRALGPLGYNPGFGGGGIGGEHDTGSGIADDGMFDGDAVAGDGIYTDAFLAAFDDYVESDFVFFLRVAMPISSQRRITYGDIRVPLLGIPRDFHQQFISNSDPQVMGTTGVTLAFEDRPGNGNLKAEVYDRQPPNRSTALPTTYRVIALSFPGSSYGGSVTFAYDPSAVTNAGLVEDQLAVFVSNSGGDSWRELPTLVDGANNTVTAITAGALPLLWAIDNGLSSIPLPMGLTDGDRFGAAVAVDDNRVAIGAPGEAGGVVYVYRIDGDQLLEEDRIVIPPDASAAQFGAALSLDAGRLLIGTGDDPPPTKGLSALQAALFDRANSIWQHKQTFVGDQGGGDAYGTSVSLSGSSMIIGAPNDGGSGAAYVYAEQATGDFSLISKFKPPNLASGSRFGTSVAASDNQLAIGAPGAMRGGINAGTVELYARIASNLQPIGSASSATPESGDEFGASIALSGGRLLVGAPGENGTEGAAYLYDVGGTLNEIHRLAGQSPSSGDRFGDAVALSGGMAAVGAPQQQNGSVYEFEAANGAAVARFQAIGSQRAVGGALGMSGDRIVIGAPASEADRGAALFDRNADILFGSDFE